MDPRVERWQRQYQEALLRSPDKKDAIDARYQELMAPLAAEWANKAQQAIDNGKPVEAVSSRYQTLLKDNGIEVPEDFDFGSMFKQGRAPQFKNVKTGSSTTAAPVGYEDRKAEAAKLAEANTNSEIPAPNPMTAEDMAFAKSKEPPRGRTVGQKLEDFSSAAGNVTVAALQDAAVKLAEAGAGANILLGQEPMAEQQFKYIQEATKDSERRRAVASGDSTLGTIAGEVAGAIAPVSALSKAGKAMDVGETLTARALAAMKQQLPAATALGNIQADSLARNVIEQGGSTEEALAVLGTGTVLNTAANLLPVSASGNVLKRAVTGGALGAGGNLAADAGIGLVSDKVPGASLEGTLAGGGIGTIFGVLSGTRPNTRIRTELPPVPPGMEAFNAGQIAAGDIAKTASFDTPIDLNAPFVQKFDTIQRKAPNYGIIPETKVNVDGIETGRVDEVPLSREDLMAKAADSVGSKEAKATQRELAAHTKEAREVQGELDGLPDKKTLAREIEDEYLEEDLRVHGEEGAFSPELTKLRQDSADAEAGRQLEEKKSTLSSQLESVSDRLQRTESEAARQAEGQAALDKLRAVERRDGKPAPAPLAPEIPDVSGVASKTAFPSQEGVSMSVTEQPKVSYPIQGKNVPLVKKQPVTTAGITTPPIGSKAAAAADTPVVTRETVQQKIDRLKNSKEDVLELDSMAHDDGTVTSTAAPPSMVQKLAEGKLTARDVLSAVKGTDVEQTSLIKYLSTLMDQIGGGDVKVVRYDANIPEHLSLAPRDKLGNTSKGLAGFYNPETNTVYIAPGKESGHTLVHEVTHGITSRMLFLGEKGRLQGSGQAQYVKLKDMFEKVVQPELKRRGEAMGESRTQEHHTAKHEATYGATNIKEFYSEVFSNKNFRQALKDIKLDPTLLKALDPESRRMVGRAKNLYDVAVRGLSRLMAKAGLKSAADLGMSGKSQNAYEVMLRQMDDLHNSLTPGQTKELAKFSTRNTKAEVPNIPGLGDRVEQRSLPRTEANETSTLVKPMSGKMAKVKELFLGRGAEPALTQRKELLSGAKQEIKAKKTALANKMTSVIDELGDGYNATLKGHLDTFLNDSSMSTVSSRAALSEISKASPELGKLVKDLTDKKTGNSVELAQALVDSQAGRKAPNELVLNLANKVIENAYSFAPRVYQGREATRAKWKLAEAGQKKLEQGKLLSNKEETAVREQNALLGYIADNVYGNKESLKTLSFDALHDLYVQRFSADQYATLKGLSNKDKRQRMVVEVAEANAALGNRPAAIKEYAAKIADMGDQADKISKYYAQLKYGSSTLATKTDVPKPIREFWGELHDPSVKLLEAVSKQETQLAEVHSMNKLKEEGLGTLFAKEEGQGMTEKLSGNKYGALEDLHTTPHIKEMIDTVVEMRPDRSMFDMWVDAFPLVAPALKAIRLAKTAATVYRPDAWLRNGIGAISQLYSNGNINPIRQAQYGVQGWKAIAELMGTAHRKEIGGIGSKMLRLGLAEASTISDTYSPATRLAMDKLLQTVGEDPEKLITGMRKILSTADSINNVAKEGYGAMDLWTKFGNFFYEKDAQKAYNKARGIEMSDSALDAMVADRIKQTNITPSRSPKVIQLVEAPGGTTYMGYYYETARTSANNLLYGLSDIKKGLADIKDGHGKAGAMMLNHGVKRVVGVVGAVGFTGAAYTGIAKAVLAGLGISASVAGDNEDLKKYMEDDGFQDPDTTLVTKDSKTGKDYGIDMGNINPYQPVWDVIKPLSELIADPSKGTEKLGKSFDKTIDLISASSVLKGAWKAKEGSKPYLMKSDPELYEELQQRGTEAGLTPVMVDRLINGLFPVIPGGLKDSAKRSFMDTDDTTKELTHVGARELNPAKDIRSFLGRSFTWDLKKAKDNYAQWLTTPATITPTQLEKGFKDAMDDIAKPYKKLANAVNAGVSMGKTEDELYASLKSANVDKETIGSILEDEVYPARLVYSDMKSLMKKQLDNELDEDKRDALADKWDVKMEMLQDILEKYEDLTLEQLEQGATSAK